MKGLRGIRIFLAVIFFVAAVAYLVIGTSLHPALKFVEKAQIIPSLLASSMGAIIVWIVLTFLLGRVYCSTVCPVGTFQDIFLRLKWKLKFTRRPFSYRPPSKIRYYILAIYVFCLLAGMIAVPFWIEPWNIIRNICGAINPTAETEVWIKLGVGVSTGVVAGILSGVLLALCALFTGRGFCTDICPIGTALGCFYNHTLMHIEIDPDKCINCMKCEDVCRSQCVKVAGRYVDNSRCVRCFDCIHVCPNDAIRFQANRNRRVTPLMQNAGTKA